MSNRKYRTLSIREKLKVIQEVDKGMEKKTDIAKKFGIPLNTLSTFLKNRETMEKSLSRNNVNRKRIRGSKYVELEKRLFECFCKHQASCVPMSSSFLKEKANEIALQLGIKFQCSNGWLHRFQERHNIVLFTKRNEATYINIENKDLHRKSDDQENVTLVTPPVTCTETFPTLSTLEIVLMEEPSDDNATNEKDESRECGKSDHYHEDVVCEKINGKYFVPNDIKQEKDYHATDRSKKYCQNSIYSNNDDIKNIKEGVPFTGGPNKMLNKQITEDAKHSIDITEHKVELDEADSISVTSVYEDNIKQSSCGFKMGNFSISGNTSNRKYKTLSIREKFKVIQEVDKGREKKTVIAKKFGIPLTTLSTYLKNRKTIEQGLLRNNVNRKRIRGAKYPKLEEELFEWFSQHQANGIPISGSLLQEKADEIALKSGIQFQCSKGWLHRFQQRHNIGVFTVCNEEQSVNIEIENELKESDSEEIKNEQKESDSEEIKNEQKESDSEEIKNEQKESDSDEIKNEQKESDSEEYETPVIPPVTRSEAFTALSILERVLTEKPSDVKGVNEKLLVSFEHLSEYVHKQYVSCMKHTSNSFFEN